MPFAAVYTLSELRSLIEHHQQTPLSVDEVLRIHSSGKMLLFNGRIAK